MQGRAQDGRHVDCSSFSLRLPWYIHCACDSALCLKGATRRFKHFIHFGRCHQEAYEVSRPNNAYSSNRSRHRHVIPSHQPRRRGEEVFSSAAATPKTTTQGRRPVSTFADVPSQIELALKNWSSLLNCTTTALAR
jgi:hypothetical protein